MTPKFHTTPASIPNRKYLYGGPAQQNGMMRIHPFKGFCYRYANRVNEA